MGKILLIDVDGTLVDYDNQLPASAVDAIRKARANEHKVYICTGRSKAEVYPNLWEIGLDGMIGGNGSYVEDHGKVVMHQLITKEQCIHVVDWLHARDAFPDMIFGGELYRDDVNKISYVLTSYKDFEDAKKEFPDLQNGTWGGAGELAIFGDLGVKGITKAHAVECLLDYLRARKEDTVAFGDAKVDIPMFECCALSVCMGSGGEEAKAAADYVTADVDDDGLYNAFVYLGLID